MEKQGKEGKVAAKTGSFFKRLTTTCSAPLTQVALFALSTWLIVLGCKGLAGLPVNRTTALADLIGILLVIGAARWFKARSDAR